VLPGGNDDWRVGVLYEHDGVRVPEAAPKFFPADFVEFLNVQNEYVRALATFAGDRTQNQLSFKEGDIIKKLHDDLMPVLSAGDIIIKLPGGLGEWSMGVVVHSQGVDVPEESPLYYPTSFGAPTVWPPVPGSEKITTEEQEQLRQELLLMDADGDGEVTIHEIMAYQRHKLALKLEEEGLMSVEEGQTLFETDPVGLSQTAGATAAQALAKAAAEEQAMQEKRERDEANEVIRRAAREQKRQDDARRAALSDAKREELAARQREHEAELLADAASKKAAAARAQEDSKAEPRPPRAEDPPPYQPVTEPAAQPQKDPLANNFGDTDRLDAETDGLLDETQNMDKEQCDVCETCVVS
jgi:hypothetical protein